MDAEEGDPEIPAAKKLVAKSAKAELKISGGIRELFLTSSRMIRPKVRINCSVIHEKKKKRSTE